MKKLVHGKMGFRCWEPCRVGGEMLMAVGGKLEDSIQIIGFNVTGPFDSYVNK